MNSQRGGIENQVGGLLNRLQTSPLTLDRIFKGLVFNRIKTGVRTTSFAIAAYDRSCLGVEKDNF